MVLLEILGIILKIIGIVLLMIFLLLLVLLIVPLRYRIQLSKEGDKLEATAEASYFLKCIRLIVAFREKKLKYKAKVLCFTCLSSEMEKNPSGEKAEKQGTGGKTKKEENPELEENLEAEGVPDEAEAKDEGKKEDTGKGDTPKGDGTEEKETDGNSTVEGNSAAEGNIKNDNEETENPGNGNQEETENQETRNQEEPENQGTRNQEEPENPENGNWEETKSPGILQRFFRKLWRLCSLPWQLVKKIKGKIQALLEKATAFLDNIRGFLQKILSIIRQGGTKYGYLKEFLQDEVNKNGIKYTGKTIFKLLKHVIPYKMKGEIIFGTGDAYSLGQILSALGIFYPLYAKSLKVVADFEAEGFRLDGKVLLKGRIRLGTMLILLVRLWFKGKLKKCLRNVMALKDRLMEPVGMK